MNFKFLLAVFVVAVALMPTAHSNRGRTPRLSPVPGCPTGWVEQFGQCYLFSTEEKTWKEADMHCRSNEAHLVSIGSPEEHEFIFLNINEWFWTGGNYNGRPSGGRTWTWNWSDGTPWNYQYWFSKQPSSKGADMCRSVQIFRTFAMSPCENRKKFICEKEASGDSAGSSALSSLSAGCPMGWKSMFGSCYQWFYTTPKTWNDAENHCQQFGGHLASLSEGENELIGKTTKGTVWIGGKKVGSQWTWSDGTPWSLGNVGTAPSPVGGDCSVTFAGRASGFDCNMERLYICKLTRSNLVTPSTAAPSSVPGIIITGGAIDEVGVRVEVFNPHTRHSCRLADLPGEVRDNHSLCGQFLCGGGWTSSTDRSCLKLNPLTGAFSPTSVSLVEARYGHLCWEIEGEGGPTLLIGGYSGRSTEKLSSNGSSSSASFPLQYDTVYACGINTGDKYVITGGADISSPGSALKTVTRYSQTGDPQTLPQLNVARRDHACGSYRTDQGDNVLLVTGGVNSNDGRLDTTEVLEDNARTWRLTGPLPSGRHGLTAAVLDNNIFVFGGYDGSYSSLSDILQYNTTSHTWEEVGQMKEARRLHAVAVLEDVSDLCP